MSQTIAWPSQAEVDAYVAARAPILGIDPTVAVGVRRAESSMGFVGDNGSSFSPFQLHYGGGLGDVFTGQTGLDARDPRNWQAATDWALRYAQSHGWGAFHGAARAGYGIWDGIRSAGTGIVRTLQYFFPVVGYHGDPTQTYHTPGGSDLFAAIGTVVRNIVNGRVVSVGTSGPGGNNLLIRGDDGRDYYYAHLKSAPEVDVGDYVPGGQKIGEVGNSGNATNSPSHLHLGVGYGIQTGTGADGGVGIGFDAQGFLSRLLAAGGSFSDPIMDGTNPISVFPDITGGIGGALKDAHQGIVNYVQNRAAGIVLLVAGVFLILAGLWGFAQRVPIVKEAVSTVQTVAGVAAMV